MCVPASSLEEAGVRGRAPAGSMNNLNIFRCMMVEAITGPILLPAVQLPVIGEAEIHRKTSLSSGPWNNGAGAPLCRESHLTGAAMYTEVNYLSKKRIYEIENNWISILNLNWVIKNVLLLKKE